MYDSLNSGSVAAIMDDEPVIKYVIKQGRKFKTPIEGTPSGQLVAVKKGENPELTKCSQRSCELEEKRSSPKDFSINTLKQIANQVLQVQQQMKQRSGAYSKTTTN